MEYLVEVIRADPYAIIFNGNFSLVIDDLRFDSDGVILLVTIAVNTMWRTIVYVLFICILLKERIRKTPLYRIASD